MLYPSGPTIPNPDPVNFKVLLVKQINNHVVALINYPDCVNYEGNKICLYLNIKNNDILNTNRLDPHFAKTGISPFARFEPTEKGFEAACLLAEKIK
jgi:hypothetical protein